MLFIFASADLRDATLALLNAYKQQQGITNTIPVEYLNNRCFEEHTQVDRVVFVGHGSIERFGKFTAYELARYLEQISLPKTVNRIDLISCSIGLSVDNNPSFAENLSKEIANRSYNVTIHYFNGNYLNESGNNKLNLIANNISVENVVDMPLHVKQKNGAIIISSFSAGPAAEYEKYKSDLERYINRIKEIDGLTAELRANITVLGRKNPANEQEAEQNARDIKAAIKKVSQLEKRKNKLQKNGKNTIDKIKKMRKLYKIHECLDFDNELNSPQHQIYNSPNEPGLVNTSKNLARDGIHDLTGKVDQCYVLDEPFIKKPAATLPGERSYIKPKSTEEGSTPSKEDKFDEGFHKG